VKNKNQSGKLTCTCKKNNFLDMFQLVYKCCPIKQSKEKIETWYSHGKEIQGTEKQESG
jgi:hypothetical protein